MRLFTVVLVGLTSGILATATPGQCTGQAQYAAQPKGSWSQKYNWFGQLLGEECEQGCNQGKDPNPTLEIAHAALIPKGTYAGYVLVWRELQEVNPNNCRCEVKAETYTWIWSPINPGTMIRIEPPLGTEMMCAGNSWDPTGKLVVAGGGTGPISDATYKFRPGALGFPQLDLSGNPFITAIASDNPIWQVVGALETPRYYPTLITLPKAPVYGTGACAPTTPNPIPGGSVLALGGPPDITSEGHEYWELMSPSSTDWSCPILPEDPTGNDPNDPLQIQENSPHFDPSSPPEDYDEYVRPGPIVAERLLDSYPRAYSMSNKDIFIEGDVDTAPMPPNDPGSSWVIRPRYLSAGNWELYEGPFSNGVAGGASDPSFDRYYGSSVLLHTLNGLDRVIAIGGSYDANYFAGTGASWVVNDTIREFEKGGGQHPFVDGEWHDKITDAVYLQRVWHNSVVLPTGEIFIVGGASNDKTAHFTSPFLQPVFEPMIYDPGADASSTGTVYCMNKSSDQPCGSGCTPQPIARLYHSVAVLLQDGRVLVAGGHWLGDNAPDSRLNGEIFSPPYLFESWRPVLEEAPTTAGFGAAFEIEVKRRPANSIDRVILLRPASVTHHNDYDQRYIELAFSLVSSSSGPTLVTDTLSVTAPGDTLGPPGYYMLFAIEAPGSNPSVRVPTIGAFLQLL